MKQETIATITKLLNNEVGCMKNRMMDCINNNFENSISERVKAYQEYYNAQQDFRDWVDEQEEDDG